MLEEPSAFIMTAGTMYQIIYVTEKEPHSSKAKNTHIRIEEKCIVHLGSQGTER